MAAEIARVREASRRLSRFAETVWLPMDHLA